MPQALRDEDGGVAVGQAEEGMNAIRSIPSYIERTDLVLVMAPPWTAHVDTGRACSYCYWRRRGCAAPALSWHIWCASAHAPLVAGRADSSSPPRHSLRAARPSWLPDPRRSHPCTSDLSMPAFCKSRARYVRMPASAALPPRATLSKSRLHLRVCQAKNCQAKNLLRTLSSPWRVLQAHRRFWRLPLCRRSSRPRGQRAPR